MQKELLTVLESYTTKNRRRRGWKKIVQILACCVVFCTTYALILPAITQESNIYCGITEHIHTDECYAQVSAADRQLACPVTGDVAHTHAEECYDATGVLVCMLPEREQHIHTAECYEQAAGSEETTAPTEPVLVCTEPLTVPHVHTADCYEQAAGSEETTAPAEPALICTEPLAEVHIHTADCFITAQAEPELICGLEEHSHTLICHSDPKADLETPEIWEQSISVTELTGIWCEDVVSIAQTQRGYVESTRNYIVLEDETIKGYTRYGAWYEDPYGDWAAMFAAFCLKYADVEGMPLESDVNRWIRALSASDLDLYRGKESYVPNPGELVFFDWETDGIADHVGIITDLHVGEDGTVPTIDTIEGDATNRVQAFTYSLDDARIVGYGQLPVQLSTGEQQAVNLVIAKIDALPTAAELQAAAEAQTNSANEGAGNYDPEVCQQVAEAYYFYSNLNAGQKKAVTNAAKLLELEFIWSVTEYIEYDQIDSDSVTAIQSAHTSDLVELNIYDYYGQYSAAAVKKTDINHRFDTISQEYPGFSWNAGAYLYKYYSTGDSWIADRHLPESLDFGNSLITDYRITDPLYEPDGAVIWDGGYRGTQSACARSVTDKNGSTGAINKITAETANRPIGVTEGTKVVSDRLGADGYPYLLYSGEGIEDYDPSLRYLFDENHADQFASKENAKSIDGLFQRDPISGEYFYNSRWNHAQYNEAASKFMLYDQIITPNFIRYPFGNFLPFNDITKEQNATQVQAFNYPGGVRDYLLATLDNLKDFDAANQGADLSVVQLIRMLESYQASWEAEEPGTWSELTAADALNDFFNGAAKMDWANQPELVARLEELYNIDYDVEKNFFFGMEMKMTFLQPQNGLTGNDNGNNETGTWEKGRDKNGDTLMADDDTMILTGTKDGKPDYPMVFSFTGDDDVWVYIDGIRFLDLSGIHRHVGGKIDFEKGMVYYYELDPAGDGDVTDKVYAEQSFREILTLYGGIAEEALGKYLKQDSNGNFTTFHDYSSHSFRFYYMERGSGSSVCDLRFNFPLLQKNTITVTNEKAALDGDELADTVLGDPDYYFNLITGENELFVGPGSVTGVTQYKVRDSKGNKLKNDDGTDKVFTTDSNGIFTLKAGQSAIFEGIGENQGTFYVQELIRAEDNGQYPLVFINERESQGNTLIDWSNRKYFCSQETTEAVYTGPDGYQWYGRCGQATDTGIGGAFVFNLENRVDTAKLGSISITAELLGTDTGRTFDMELTLDGEKLPVGTKYTVGGEERITNEAGIITVGAGETATIHNILSGTRFEVRQIEIDGYTVSYAYATKRSANGNPTAQNGSVTGVIYAERNVAVSVTSTENGTSVQIPVTVCLANGDGEEHGYTVVLEQVTDSTGETLMQNGTVMEQAVQITDEPASFSFNLPYVMSQIDTLPATFYYRIAEKDEQIDCLDNTQLFVAEVLVEEAEDGILATLVAVNGSSDLPAAEFVNTLSGSLTLRNTVNGDAEQKAQTFDYELVLTPPENVVLPAELQAVRTAADGTQTMLTLQPEDGRIWIEGLADGEAVTVSGVPAGTQWSICQITFEGFIVTTRMGDLTQNGRTATGSVVTGDTAVDYRNTQTYYLPKTGSTGTSQYTMAGWVLMLCSAAYLLYNFVKRRKGASLTP